MKKDFPQSEYPAYGVFPVSHREVNEISISEVEKLNGLERKILVFTFMGDTKFVRALHWNDNNSEHPISWGNWYEVSRDSKFPAAEFREKNGRPKIFNFDGNGIWMSAGWVKYKGSWKSEGFWHNLPNSNNYRLESALVVGDAIYNANDTWDSDYKNASEVEKKETKRQMSGFAKMIPRLCTTVEK